jgi:hypothetical protein
MASSSLKGRVSTSTPLKASGRWRASSPWWHVTSSLAAAVGDDDSECERSTLDQRTSMYFLFFSKVFSVVWQGQLYPYPPCMHTCKLSLSSNAEIYYQKNEMRSPF